MSQARDVDIRTALVDWLRHRYRRNHTALIRHELALHEGERRADLALVEDELSGYEIKSDVDTLTRLDGQVTTYNKVFDRAWIVTTPQHLDKAIPVIPAWWGVIVASPAPIIANTDWADEGLVPLSIAVTRPALRNHNVEPESLVRLLWREEALEVLRSRRMARGLSKRDRTYLWRHLAHHVPTWELRHIVRGCLQQRTSWRSKTAFEIG